MSTVRVIDWPALRRPVAASPTPSRTARAAGPCRRSGACPLLVTRTVSDAGARCRAAPARAGATSSSARSQRFSASTSTRAIPIVRSPVPPSAGSKSVSVPAALTAPGPRGHALGPALALDRDHELAHLQVATGPSSSLNAANDQSSTAVGRRRAADDQRVRVARHERQAERLRVDGLGGRRTRCRGCRSAASRARCRPAQAGEPGVAVVVGHHRAGGPERAVANDAARAGARTRRARGRWPSPPSSSGPPRDRAR